MNLKDNREELMGEKTTEKCCKYTVISQIKKIHFYTVFKKGCVQCAMKHIKTKEWILQQIKQVSHGKIFSPVLSFPDKQTPICLYSKRKP